MKDIYILGVGNNTLVFIELATLCGYKVKGLYHYNKSRVGEIYYGIKIIDDIDNLFKNEDLSNFNFALSMGNNLIRDELFNTIKYKNGNTPTLIHPSAIISKYATIEEGVIINAFSKINTETIIKQNTIISVNVNISHNTTINKSCYISQSANIGAKLSIGKNSLIGQGAILISEKGNVGEYVTIGAGSVVTKNIENNKSVKGNPAK
jgi:sugar O-acyltransferase (sialic acid O-acetyltransferase NeuD family)